MTNSYINVSRDSLIFLGLRIFIQRDLMLEYKLVYTVTYRNSKSVCGTVAST